MNKEQYKEVLHRININGVAIDVTEAMILIGSRADNITSLTVKRILMNEIMAFTQDADDQQVELIYNTLLNGCHL